MNDPRVMHADGARCQGVSLGESRQYLSYRTGDRVLRARLGTEVARSDLASLRAIAPGCRRT